MAFHKKIKKLILIDKVNQSVYLGVFKGYKNAYMVEIGVYEPMVPQNTVVYSGLGQLTYPLRLF